MSFAHIQTRTVFGIHAHSVALEVHLSPGLPSFNLVGLPETAVKESKDRVRSALINSQFEFPTRKITVNLAPAELPKSGGGFDLPMAIALLAASSQIETKQLHQHELIGELALNGDLRPVSSIIPAVLALKKTSKILIIPAGNAQEAALTGATNVFYAHHLKEICQYFNQKNPLQPLPLIEATQNPTHTLDWSDVKGQEHAKKALYIAACGGHNVLMHGTPGSGKTMLAKRMQTLLPLLTEEQALQSAAIYALRGKKPDPHTWRIPPFRAPHHTASAAALVGGGQPPKPGEISLATHGILFLDELPEFNRHVLETLREPLESGQISIARASAQIDFPAQFQFIAAMNPCPCGHFGSARNTCHCPPERVKRYQQKLSAPFLDRIDIHVNVQELSPHDLLNPHENQPKQSPILQNQVLKCRNQQIARQECLNAHLSPQLLEKFCKLNHPERTFLDQTMQRFKLSARAYHRLLKVARTLADTCQQNEIDVRILKQAFALRQTI